MSEPFGQPAIEDLGDGLHAIDTGFQRPFFDASHLIVENGRAAFVDAGTNHSVPALLQALERLQVERDAVDYVIVTHVHLDHAGGAGELLRHLPAAKLVVHPRGARHMIDPTALTAGASGVYGADVVERTYGRLVPVDPARVLEAPEGFVLELSGRPLLFLDTPGHARHHVCIWDARSRSFFTGDTFGLAYREFQSPRGAFILPTTTPVQFDPDALKASIARMLAFSPEAMLLTHYSRVTGVERLASDLYEQIDAHVALARAAHGRPDRHERLKAALLELFLGRAADHGSPVSPERAAELLALDVELNAQGLEVWLDRAP